MNTLRGLLARERRNDSLALRDDETEREYDSHRLLTNAWKTGNLLHHAGVRRGHTVGVVGKTPETVLAFLGAVSLGASVEFDPPAELDARAVVAPTAEISKFDLPPGGTPVAYGEKPADPRARHFERDTWSQNPTLAPAELAPDDAALVTADATASHADLLDTAETAIERAGMTAGTTTAVRAPLSLPGTVAAGVVASLLAGATVVLPAADTTTDVGVASEPAPDATTIDPRSLV